MADFIVRPLEPDDSIEELTSLLHRAYKQLGDMGLNFTAVDQTPEKTLERLEGAACFVAELDGRLIGTIRCQRPDPNDDVMEYRKPGVVSWGQFGVDPKWQGKGVASALHQAIVEQAKAWGGSSLALDTAIPATHLVDMYTRWGYRIVDEHQWEGKTYRSYIMRLDLVE